MRVKVSILNVDLEPIWLELGEHLIGRGDEDSGVFPEIDLEPYDVEAKVSRRHAILRLTRKGLTIEDVGSLNGTFINRKPRLTINERHALHSGDEVAIGSTFLRFEISAKSDSQ